MFAVYIWWPYFNVEVDAEENEKWKRLPGRFETQQDAEWALAKWRQSAACMNDSMFKVERV